MRTFHRTAVTTLLGGGVLLLGLALLAPRPPLEAPLAPVPDRPAPANVGPGAQDPRVSVPQVAPFRSLTWNPLGRSPLEKGIDARARMPGPVVPPALARLVVHEHLSGCFASQDWERVFERSEDGFVAADGTRLAQAELESLRARVLASRPGPGASAHEILAEPRDYLAALGLTDERILAHAPAIRRLCVGDWTDAAGRPLGIPPEAEDLFTLASLRGTIAAFLLRAPSRSTNSETAVIELPGDPPIWLGTESNGYELVPWYALAGDQRWYLLDPELARDLGALGPEDGWMRRRLAETRDWRDALWSDPRVWAGLRAELDHVLLRVSYRRVPGWESVEAFLEPLDPGHPRPSARLPDLDLRVRRPGAIDDVLVRPEPPDDQDWNDVLAAFTRAEALASAQPWLASWKQRNGGRIGLVLPEGLARRTDARAVRERVERDLPGPGPVFLLAFELPWSAQGSLKTIRVGSALLAADGALLILDSTGVHGPLASVESLGSRFAEEGRYGLVLPGGALEMRTDPR